jgi:hypothetical protein
MNEIIVPIHVGILTLTLICIVWADIYASMWLHGKKQTLNGVVVDRLHTAVTIGLTGMIVTGITLFWPLREYLVSQSDAFFVKMFFAFALVVNSFVIEKYMNVATTRSFKEVSVRQKVILFVSGGISSLSWVGAIIAATQLL